MPPAGFDDLNALAKIARVLEDAGFRYRVDSGTLLGLVREGNLLPKDPDLDVMVIGTADDAQLRQMFLRNPIFSAYSIFVVTFGGKVIELNFVPNVRSRGRRRIDIKFFQRVGTNLIAPAGIPRNNHRALASYVPGKLLATFGSLWRWKILQTIQRGRNLNSRGWRKNQLFKTWVIPLALVRDSELIEVQGHRFHVPSPAGAYLEARYGDWQKPARRWDYWNQDKLLANLDPFSFSIAREAKEFRVAK